MVKKEDVERLISANENVRGILGAPSKSPFVKLFMKPPERQAAKVICDEFSWLVDENPSYWEGLQEASERLGHYRKNEAQFFSNIIQLIDQEVIIFEKLGIDKDKSEAIVGQAYSALRIIKECETPSPDGLKNLRDRLNIARGIICQASKGGLHRACDKMLGHKSALIFSGLAVGGANVAIMVADQGTVSWVSLKVGYHIANGNVEELIKIFSGE